MNRIKGHTTQLLLLGIALLSIILIVLIALFVSTTTTPIASLSAQAEIEEEKKARVLAQKEGFYDTDPIEVVDLSELIGCSLDEAVKLVGHGAELDGEPNLVAGGLTKVSLLLGEVSATIDTGTACVELYLDRSGKVVQASCQFNINGLSCANLPFDRIVDDARIVERLLRGAGLSQIEPDPIVVPAKEDYARYDSSGKAIIEERYQFMGTGSARWENEEQFEWSVLLDYDYAQAIKTNNLANTIRTVNVSISSLDL